MPWQSDTINPAVTSPAGDITKITNDLAVLRAVLGGGADAAVPFVFNGQDRADVASAATVNLSTTGTNYVRVTGTTTITAITLGNGDPRFVVFDNALTLTHGASLILPGAANITTAAGDCALFIGEASGAVRCVAYQRASGAPIVPGVDATTSVKGISQLATQAEAQAGTNTTKTLTPDAFRAANIVLGTAVASTSGTSIDFTGISSLAKRVTVMLDGVSTNGTSLLIAQIGDAGGVEPTGYSGASGVIESSPSANVTANSSGANLVGTTFAAAWSISGQIVFNRLSGNTWAFSLAMGFGGSTRASYGAGTKTLSDTLDRVRITTVNGTDTFDAGQINISWE